MKVGSFKKHLNDVKLAPYRYILGDENIDDGKATTEEPTKQDHDKEEVNSLLQYLLYANAKN